MSPERRPRGSLALVPLLLSLTLAASAQPPRPPSSGAAPRTGAAPQRGTGKSPLPRSAEQPQRALVETGGALVPPRIGHRGVVNAVDVSADGSLIVSGSADRTVRLWDGRSGRCLATLTGHTAPVTCVRLSPDARLAASGSEDTTVRLWDTKTGMALRTLSGHTLGVTTIAFSPDGQFLASGGSDAAVKLWDTASGALRRELAGSRAAVSAVAFSPDGKTLASGGYEGIVRRWEAATGAALPDIGKAGWTGARGVTGLRLEGGRLAGEITGTYAQLGCDSIDLPPGRIRQIRLRMRHNIPGFKSLRWAVGGPPDDSPPSDFTLRFDIPPDNEFHEVLLPVESSRRITGLRLDLDWGGVGDPGRTFEIAEITGLGAEEVKIPLTLGTGPPAGVSALAYSPDGALLATGGWETVVRLWDTRNGAAVRVLTGERPPDAVDAVRLIPRAPEDAVRRVSFSRDGTELLEAGPGLWWWSLRTGAVVRSMRGPSAAALDGALAADGSLVASGHADWTVRCWDARTGAARLTLGKPGAAPPELELQTGHTGEVRRVAISPDGRLAASSSEDGTVKVWDAAAGVLLRTLRVSVAGYRGVAFSPDGKTLATGSANQIQFWEVPRVALRATWNVAGGNIRSISFAPDGSTVAVVGSHEGIPSWLRLYEYPSGRLARSLDAGAAYHGARIPFSPDGRWLACESGDGTVKLWDARTGSIKWAVKGGGPLAFSPDSKTLASGGAGSAVNLWNVETGSLTRTLKRNSLLRDVAFLPGGRSLITAGDGAPIESWDAATGAPQRNVRVPDATYTFALDAGGTELAAAAFSGSVFIIDLKRFVLKHSLGARGELFDVAVAPQGDLLLSGGSAGALRLWDLRSGMLARSLPGLTATALSVAFSPDGSMAAAGGEDGRIRLWDVVSGSPLRTVGRHPSGVCSLAFSPDGGALACAGEDGSRRVWDLSGQSPPRDLSGARPQAPRARGVAYSPTGDLLATIDDRDVQLWDTRTWQVTKTLRGQAEPLASIAFSPDGGTLAAANGGGERDQPWDVVRLWDVRSGQQIRTLKGTSGITSSLSFSPDGRRLAGGVLWFGVNCWDLGSGNYQYLLGHGAAVTAVAFGSDSTMLVSASHDDSIQVWDTVSGRSRARLLTPAPPSAEGKPSRPAAPAAAPAAPGALGWEVAAGGPREAGLLLRDGGDGATERTERGGRPGVGTRPGSLYLYFQAARAPGPGPAYVLVEYFDDRPTGPLGLEYDSRDPKAGPVEGAYARADDVAGGERRGTGEWRRAVFLLEQPRWERRQNLQSDFRLNGWDGGPLFVRSVQVTAAQPADWEALTAAAVSKDYLVVTPEGYYTASPGADRYLQFGLAGKPYPAECFHSRYERSDLVEQSLAGQKVPAPSPLQGPYPPRLSVLERPAEKLAGERLQVTVRLEDDSAVLRLACFLNGSRVPAQVERLPASALDKSAGTTGDPNTGGGTFRVTLSVPPEAAAVKLALAAYDDDELQSPRQELLFSHTPVVNPAAGRLLGLCVGVSRYRTARLNLKFADQDAASLTQALNAQPGLYRSTAVRDLRNEQATAAGVKGALDALAGQVTKQDTVVLFFSGHGWQAEDGSFYFATHETELGNLRGTALAWSEVVSRLTELSRKGKRVLVLLDACHSGSAASSDQLVRAVLAAEAGVTVLASSRGGEYSFEQQELRHGAFTAALLEALGGKATPESQMVSLWELRGYVERRVRELTAERQHPQVPYLQDFDTGAPFLVAARSAN